MNFKKLVFLTKTDTTIGFISQNNNKLNKIKNRPKNKKFITAIDSINSINKLTRIPLTHKKRVRRAVKTTFVIKDESFRVVKDKRHLLLLNRLGWAYTTSANLSGKKYNEDFAKENADVIISPLDLKIKKASAIFKLGKKNIKRLRA
ncbi:MAG: Sua5/YciO/YrdC/YwlC family protein [Epsilonproteobacteria bacterium]|nr:Sua5/YciO/YrdC/YwlC family protein [Campylobacterota bacterium]